MRKRFSLFRQASKRFVGVLILAALPLAGTATAQVNQDKAWYEEFIDSVGTLLYKAAWPSDTYDRMTLGSINLMPGGADVSLRLYGHSWLEGPNWTDVVAEIRDGKVNRLRWGQYHAAWRPGLLVDLVTEAIDQMNKQNDLSVICIKNTSAYRVSYSLPSDGPDGRVIDPGDTWKFTHPGSAEFVVSFRRGGDATATLHLPGVLVDRQPASCDESMLYDFVDTDQGVELIRVAPGRIGVTLALDNGDLFPRITSVDPGTPAARAGVQPGSYVVRINNQSTRDLKLEEVFARVRGKAGTSISLGLSIPGRSDIVMKELTRE